MAFGIQMQAGSRHAQRLEKPLVSVILNRLSCDFVEDRRQKLNPFVAISPDRSWLIDRSEMKHESILVANETDTRITHQREASGHRKKVPKGHFSTETAAPLTREIAYALIDAADLVVGQQHSNEQTSHGFRARHGVSRLGIASRVPLLNDRVTVCDEARVGASSLTQSQVGVKRANIETETLWCHDLPERVCLNLR
jgi:hypothetical protein